MGTLHIILNIVLILASAALVVSVLMQKTKSSGLGRAFGSDTASFNTARNKAVSKEAKLQKITLILGIVIAVLTIAMMFVK